MGAANNHDEERWKNGIEDQIRELRDDMKTVQGFQKWQLGGMSVVAWVFGLLSAKIKKVLGF